MRIPLFAMFTATAIGCGLAIVGSDVVPGVEDGGGPDGKRTDDGSPSNSDASQLGDEGVVIDGASDGPTDASTDPLILLTDALLPTSTPGLVTCGDASCNTLANEFCCVGKGTCASDPIVCGTFKEIACDEPLDCANRCCLTRNSAESNNASTRCQSSCSGEGVRVCRTNTDCNDGGACKAVTCLGLTLGTCYGDIPPQCVDGG